MATDGELEAAAGAVARFMRDESLATRIASIEHDLDECHASDVARIVSDRGLTPDLLRAALLVRDQLGRINDLIHATAISLALSSLLEANEVLGRPSLAAGNDRSRLYDVETDVRVAEFKLARWDGHDAMRKRQVFKDLVHLAADESGRRPELFVRGQRPLRFLRETESAAAWGLDRFPATRLLFSQRFGSLDVPIRDFVSGPGSRVDIIDLEQRLPELFVSPPQMR